MKYYIDNQVLAVYKELPLPSDTSQKNRENRFVISNPNRRKIYLDILEKIDEVWVKLRFYENRKDEKTGEIKLVIFEAYSTMLPQNHIKIEGLHDIDLYDGRFNIQQVSSLVVQNILEN